jgi:hypothetical protein
MRTHFFVIILLFVGIYATESFLEFNMQELPNSNPTDVELFMEQIAKIESGGNHKVVNQYGMMGRYQFSPTTVRGLGFRVTQQEFLQNKELQDTVMVTYMRTNYKELAPLINRYEGKVIDGVKINRATVLAGAHFAGSGGMRSYLVSNGQRVVVDGNGTSLKVYMQKFTDINLPSFHL